LNDFIYLKKEVENKTLEIEDKSKKLIQLNENKTNFLIMLLNEAKNPLTMINIYLEKEIKEKGITDNISIISRNIKKLIKNLTNIIDMEYLDRDSSFYNHDQIINFSSLIKSKIQLFSEIAKKKNIIISSDIENYLHIKIDPYAADRIINNIIDNAIRYNGNNCTIDIILKSASEKIYFIVKDTGMGISEEKLMHIFEPYYQIANKKNNLQGLGVGLSIVKKITDEINAKIIIRSDLDAGTTFIISFNKEHIEKNEFDSHVISYSKPLDDYLNLVIKDIYEPERFNILIIEDNIELLYFLQNSLSKSNNIFYSLNIADAFEKINKIQKPDLIISEIMMNSMEGKDFYNILKKEEKYNSIPFIFLTSNPGNKAKIQSIIDSDVEIITKPFNIEELEKKIETLKKYIDLKKLSNKSGEKI